MEILRPLLDERLLRLWAPTEAQTLGHGGITAVAAATSLSRTTISAGIAEIQSGAAAEVDGGWRCSTAREDRKRKETHDPGLLAALDALVKPGSRGDPMSPLRWTCLSVRQLATTLTGQGHPVSPQKVAQMLHEAGYSL